MSKQTIIELAMATQQGKMTFPSCRPGSARSRSGIVPRGLRGKAKDPLPDGWNHVHRAHDPGPRSHCGGVQQHRPDRSNSRRPGRHRALPRVREAVVRRRRHRLLGISDGQKSDLLRPERRTTHRGVPEAAGMSKQWATPKSSAEGKWPTSQVHRSFRTWKSRCRFTAL